MMSGEWVFIVNQNLENIFRFLSTVSAAIFEIFASRRRSISNFFFPKTLILGFESINQHCYTSFPNSTIYSKFRAL